jgi:hypothetical protein
MSLFTRTGLRKPLNYLKTWSGPATPDWPRRLSRNVSVGLVDEELPVGHDGGRKSWYVTVTQDEDLLETLGPVRGAPTTGKTLLLFEDDIVKFVQHLWDTGLLVTDDAGRFVNGHAAIWERARRASRVNGSSENWESARRRRRRGAR